MQKVALILIMLCITWLGKCQGSCVRTINKAEVKDGSVIPPDGCTSPLDGTKHGMGSEWNGANGMKCTCSRSGAECCDNSIPTGK
ncbi:small serum protein 3-like [Podarcis raffonei]|uniref:small serum protein 3-like n=1 Tax=Podarcis raffonei TaxID=65483 RepID=UPI002329664B|nr:small serum protein 3-like [Podarcis raffonei]